MYKQDTDLIKTRVMLEDLDPAIEALWASHTAYENTKCFHDKYGDSVCTFKEVMDTYNVFKHWYEFLSDLVRAYGSLCLIASVNLAWDMDHLKWRLGMYERDIRNKPEDSD